MPPIDRRNCWPTPRKSTLTIDGRTLKFTNLKKVFYPDEGYTKRDVLNYYDAVADLILPHLKDRPLSLKRYPNGIKEEFFFQKDTPETCRALAAHRADRFRAQPEAHPLRLRRRPRQPAVPGESRLHRPQSVDEPVEHLDNPISS